MSGQRSESHVEPFNIFIERWSRVPFFFRTQIDTKSFRHYSNMTPATPPGCGYEVEKERYKPFLGQEIIRRSGDEEAIRTAPLFSLAVKHKIDRQYIERKNTPSQKTENGSSETTSDAEKAGNSEAGISGDPDAINNTAPLQSDSLFPQYGLLGFSIRENDGTGHHEPIMFNMHAPNSVFICGSQGSGKSYTLACLLENCLLSDPRFGQVQQPIAGLAFNYDTDSSGAIAETVHLCSRGVKVNVLVSSSNFDVTLERYRVATQGSANVTIEKFLLPPGDLSVERMYRLMAFSEKAESVPLYMEVIQKILRQMAVSGQDRDFNYGEFLRLLDAANLTTDQQRPMRLRLDLLQSFMRWPPTKSDLKRKTPKKLLNLRSGTLTIVDLSDPFLDDTTVCMLFDICLSIAKENRPKCGLVVALDEAHKYMNQSPTAKNFTDRLLLTVREQRHIGIRVIIATQEPTISEKLLDLCSVSIVHQFKSPAWFQTIRNHLGGASSISYSSDGQVSLFEDIIGLGVGESRVFAPSAFVRMDEGEKPERLGSGVIHMKTRTRVGVDGGVSVMVGEGNGFARESQAQ
jgi:hypothetical protein